LAHLTSHTATQIQPEMAGKKKQAQAAKQNGTDNFPGLKSPGQPASKTQYHELQENELIALEAIYGEDFTQHSAAHSAWQVRCP